ncbi:MAG: PP2C family protein-serine/threonine phosphatase [Tepidisphaeraceae bacterium]
MSTPQDWQEELDFVVDFMRELSTQTDPQTAAELYGRRLREWGLVRTDGFLAVSRRDLKYPAYRITRSSTWKEAINPWLEKHRLPIYTSGILSELIYSNELTIIEDLASRLAPDDPASEYFEGMKFLLAIPQFDGGEAINMSVMMTRDAEGIDRKHIPVIVLQSNLWGRSVLSSVLRRELKSAYDALDREFKMVGHIQRSLLPTSLPEIPGLDLAAHYETSTRAGGDYYDFFPLSKNRWGIFMADVSGHGVPAAVRMAITHALAHTRPESDLCSCDMLMYLNSVLEGRYIGQTGAFVTAFYGIYDTIHHRLKYSSAGHPPPRLARGGEIVPVDGPGGIPLGIEPDVDYREYEIPLQSGDRMLLYTDGISEAFSPSRDQFTTDGMDKALLRGNGSAACLLKDVLEDLKRHTGAVQATDDRTMLAICVK